MPLLSESGIVDTLAKAESTTDTMKKMYDAYRRAEDEEKMKKPGKVNVGGAILNFAKK
jgi:isochorismate hydrolase